MTVNTSISKNDISKNISEKKVTVPIILDLKNVRPISALTAYDYTFASLIDQCGIDIILVGDSLSHTVQGNQNTLPVTLDEMVYHTKCVCRGVLHSMVITDLPFLTYQISPEQGLLSAGRVMKETGACGIKLEGGVNMRETIRKIVSVDIPVVGHIGLTPQSYHRMGGYKKHLKIISNSPLHHTENTYLHLPVTSLLG